jgi:hypothetical protein
MSFDLIHHQLFESLLILPMHPERVTLIPCLDLNQHASSEELKSSRCAKYGHTPNHAQRNTEYGRNDVVILILHHFYFRPVYDYGLQKWLVGDGAVAHSESSIVEHLLHDARMKFGQTTWPQ